MEYANLFLIFACFVFLIQLIRVKKRFEDLNSFIQQLNNLYNLPLKTIPKSIKEEYVLPHFVIRLLEITLFIVLGVLILILGGFVATLISITMI